MSKNSMKLGLLFCAAYLLVGCGNNEESKKSGGGPRACSKEEIQGLSPIISAAGRNDQYSLRYACQSYFTTSRTNLDTCVAVAEITIQTKDGEVKPGEALTIDQRELKRICEETVQASNRPTTTTTQQPQSGLSCSDVYFALYTRAVQQKSSSTCSEFRRTFNRDFYCTYRHDGVTRTSYATEIYSVCAGY